MNEHDPLIEALAKLRPAKGQTNMPILMYQAGQASRDVIVSRWRAAFFGTFTALVGSWILFYWGLVPSLANRSPAVRTLGHEVDGSNLSIIGKAILGEPSTNTSMPAQTHFDPSR
jgi:hypothetical protein